MIALSNMLVTTHKYFLVGVFSYFFLTFFLLLMRTEQWMEKEANEAQKRVQATVASYYQQYMTSNANNSNNVGVTPLKIDLDSVPVPTFTGTVGPVTEQMKAVVGKCPKTAQKKD